MEGANPEQPLSREAGKRGGGRALHPRGSLLSVAGRVFFSQRVSFSSSRRSFFFLSPEFLLFLSSEFLLSRRRDDDRRILTLSAISLTANAREALKLQNI